VTTLPTGVQHRHPSWSPDHTKIAYAAGPPFSATGSYEIWIKDMVTGAQTKFLDAAPHQDHPVWSPDGQSIAYGSNGDIWVKGIAPGSQPVQLTNNPEIEERPYWSADGSTIYYTRDFGTAMAPNRDIYKKSPVTPGGTETDIVSGTTNDWQVASSPDNKRICWLRGGQDATADIWVGNTDGSDLHPFANTAGVGELNCVWSPDGSRILYTLGIFSAGNLQTKDFFGTTDPLSTMSVADHFDGNADWATNLSPTCDNRTVNTGVNQFVQIQLSCTDPDSGAGAAPPTPVPIDAVFMDITGKPTHGNIGSLSEDARLIYTPAKNFKGTDTISYTGNDTVSTGPAGTITIHVGTDANGVPDNVAPAFSSVRLSAKKWRRGNKLPSISKAKVGTTISFRLSEAGQVTLGFQRKTIGRRVGGKCRKQTKRNRSRRRCTRFVSAGHIAPFAGKVGLNKVRFQGRLSRSKRLRLGTYRVVLKATDSANNTSKPRTGPTFRIVAH
jgi:Tol biopolymer transport system component